MGKLTQVSTSDGLDLQGYYIPCSDKKVVVLHIHGLEGNFYEPKALILANELEKANIGFLTVNTRGNGKDTDFYTQDGSCRRGGSRYELLEEAHLDITAWLKFLISEGYQNIILQGHSAGTIKAVRYLFEGELKERVNRLILLAPIDPIGFRLVKGRSDIEGYLGKAQAKVNEGKGEELITPEFDHDILSYQTFISWYKRDNLGMMFEFSSLGYDFPVLRGINIPTKIIVGSKDKYFHPSNPEHPEEAMALLLKHIPVSEGKIIDGAVHSFELHEAEMSQEIVKFINRET